MGDAAGASTGSPPGEAQRLPGPEARRQSGRASICQPVSLLECSDAGDAALFHALMVLVGGDLSRHRRVRSGG